MTEQEKKQYIKGLISLCETQSGPYVIRHDNKDYFHLDTKELAEIFKAALKGLAAEGLVEALNYTLDYIGANLDGTDLSIWRKVVTEALAAYRKETEG